MKEFKDAFDARFRPHRGNYILQSVMAGAAVFLVLIALRQQNLVVAASLAATAFTVFTMPSSVTASARNVVGGHMIGVIFGGLFSALCPDSVLARDGLYALAVGCSVLSMSVTNTEHPPAAGTALGVVIGGFSARVFLGVLVGAGILAVIHRVLRPLLRDLIAAPEVHARFRSGVSLDGPSPVVYSAPIGQGDVKCRDSWATSLKACLRVSRKGRLHGGEDATRAACGVAGLERSHREDTQGGAGRQADGQGSPRRSTGHRRSRAETRAQDHRSSAGVRER